MSRYGSENPWKFNRYELNVFVKKLRMIHTCHFPASIIKGNTARQLVFLLLRGTDTQKKKQIKETAIDFNSSEGNNDHLSKHHGAFTEVVVRQRENAAGIRGTQREYSSKPLKHSIVNRILVFTR